MANKLTKRDLYNYGITSVAKDHLAPGGYIIFINGKPIKTSYFNGGFRITVTDKNKPQTAYKGINKPYRRSLPLARVIVAWEKGSVEASEVAYYDAKSRSYVACERSKFWYNHPAEIKR